MQPQQCNSNKSTIAWIGTNLKLDNVNPLTSLKNIVMVQIRIGLVACRLALLAKIRYHNVFHVYFLQNNLQDPNHVNYQAMNKVINGIIPNISNANN